MALRVGIVGLPNSGKTTLFNALTRAGAQVTAYADVTQKPNLGMAVIPDHRVEPARGGRRLEEGHTSRHPYRRRSREGGDPGRAASGRRAARGRSTGFSDGADPAADLETLRLELIVADREHVERRLERVRKEAKSGDRAKREEAGASTERLLAHLDEGHPLSEWAGELPSELEPLDDEAAHPARERPGRHRLRSSRWSSRSSRTRRRPSSATGASALDDVVMRLKEALGLITFFTVGDTEARSWTLRHGQTALDAADSIHSDIARGFIRCEVIRWDDLLECGSHAEAARRGLQRLEGKTYVVEDGDVLNIRFNV